MSDLNFTKATDEVHEIKLDSYLISASWVSGMAFVGGKAKFEVRTVFVGNGAKVKATGKTEKGKKLGKVKGKMQNNVFTGEFEIPDKVELDDQIFFEVDLSANSLSGESAKIPVYPLPKLKSAKWSADEARRGDVLTMSAELENVKDGTEVKLVILEFDQDGGHDIITDLQATVKESKIEVKWEYEYHEDTDELPTSEEVEAFGGSYNPPEYFFTVNIADFELGRENQDSGLLLFKDWMEFTLIDDKDEPIPNMEYEITLPDGSTQSGTLNDEGYVKLEDIPPGKCTIKYKIDQEEIEMTSIESDDDSDSDSDTGVEAEDEDEDQDVNMEDDDEEDDSDNERGRREDDSDDDSDTHTEVEIDDNDNENDIRR